jgi:hypothetical protein
MLIIVGVTIFWPTRILSLLPIMLLFHTVLIQAIYPVLALMRKYNSFQNSHLALMSAYSEEESGALHVWIGKLNITLHEKQT